MKANELRIGNWVMGDSERPYQIELSDFSDWYNDHNSHTYGDHVHPIPITEEWLEKLRFEKDDIREAFYVACGEYRIRVSVNVFSGTLEKDSSWFVSVLTGYANQPMTIVQQYIHQLQNLYYALTGEELT